MTRDDLEFNFSGLIVDDLDVDILAGVPFMEENDVSVRPKNKIVSVGDNHHFMYEGSVPNCSTNVRSAILRTTTKATVWPGDFLDVSVGSVGTDKVDALVAIEPHMLSSHMSWPLPGIYQSVGSHIRIMNVTGKPQVFKKHAHIALATPVFEPPEPVALDSLVCSTSSPSSRSPVSDFAGNEPIHSASICVNPDSVMSDNESARFSSLHKQFDAVFSPKFATYNHKFGPFEAVVNMGTVQEGQVEYYSSDDDQLHEVIIIPKQGNSECITLYYELLLIIMGWHIC